MLPSYFADLERRVRRLEMERDQNNHTIVKPNRHVVADLTPKTPVPVGTWQSWTPTVTGWAANYVRDARYCKVGKLCFIYLRITGTSNATDAKVTLPLPAYGGLTIQFQVPMFIDNSTTYNTGGRCFVQVRPADDILWFYLDGSATGWTASNTKYVSTSLFYEVA